MKYLVLLIVGLSLYSCKKDIPVTDPDAYLSAEEVNAFKYSIIRYVDKMPKKATPASKFDKTFDSEYKVKAENAELIFYYKDKKTGDIYFAITKTAPSIKRKKVVTAGRLKQNENGEITDYEEAFRTWKMEMEELEEKAALLFEKYIRGEDLSPYYTENSNGEFYIEFPDANTYYDKELRQWKLISSPF